MGIPNYSITSRSNSVNSIYYINYIKSLSFDNKYTKWYIAIITRGIERYKFDCSIKIEQNKRRARKIYGYLEFHHIVPRSIDNSFSTEIDNLVALTAKEHFLCHLLLTKMIKKISYKNKMIFAFKRMMTCSNGKRYVSSYYSLAKLNMPAVNKDKFCITNGIETKFHNKNLPIPAGWLKGTSREWKNKQNKSNQKNKKIVVVKDLLLEQEYEVRDIKRWSMKNIIPYSTLTSAIRKSHTVRNRYQLSWAAG